MFCKKSFPRNFAKSAGKHLCQRLFFYKVAWPKSQNLATLSRKVSLALVFSCKFCEISKNTFFHRTPPMAASESSYFPKLVLKNFFFFSKPISWSVQPCFIFLQVILKDFAEIVNHTNICYMQDLLMASYSSLKLLLKRWRWSSFFKKASGYLYENFIKGGVRTLSRMV